MNSKNESRIGGPHGRAKAFCWTARERSPIIGLPSFLPDLITPTRANERGAAGRERVRWFDGSAVGLRAQSKHGLELEFFLYARVQVRVRAGVRAGALSSRERCSRENPGILFAASCRRPGPQCWLRLSLSPFNYCYRERNNKECPRKGPNLK